MDLVVSQVSGEKIGDKGEETDGYMEVQNILAITDGAYSVSQKDVDEAEQGSLVRKTWRRSSARVGRLLRTHEAATYTHTAIGGKRDRDEGIYEYKKERAEQWNFLISAKRKWGDVWAIAGDWNDLCSNEEKRGGRLRIERSFCGFKEFIHQMGMQ
ncbi:ferritin light chain [Striga asiatica]|uniref:Ferritin light chain n=1 Tax=Striga asiatica TaxID=4170 RepID=A0A5A7QCI7_STRAF|nr:ferritin light chain [Striga asiatica]